MDAFEIHGGRPLHGETPVYGAKNAVLPILAATVMVEDTCVLEGVPELEDVRVMMDILTTLGARVTRTGDRVEVDAGPIRHTNVPPELMRRMRSSVFLMGPLLSRFGEVRVSKPGGCVIGQRPIDFHLRGMRALGAAIEEKHGFIRCAANRLYGTQIVLDFPSVGATENLIMAAVLADGVTVIENAAREPEIVDLARFLNRCGARVEGAGEDRVVVTGVHHLHGTVHRVIPDRIVAGTMMIAAAATRGCVTLTGVEPQHLGAVIGKLRETGARVEVDHDIITVECSAQPRAVDIRTAPYPGFPTDLQAPMMALLTMAQGTSVIRESVFEARFKHVNELVRMGADVSVDLRTAVVRGVPRLSGALVEATDLRGGAALIVAGLAAEGLTRVEGLRHIDRGYQQIDVYLRDLGADMVRV
ncbi:UDP-N-acetylglucosamine 1-carboxyvinyltransferase [Alicyclobacillus macrosporangiidus]|uniref:UDP-N-acetylglucosamine 1-carboxyvinyltransferase n=1 Tax=Alicyclobacillus macrosporangiidus TaxID=392015 RepID=A0A1I7HAF7_9BACL|nr:UDP-N-acetylglucosamine 1-carboxyvinyltransferase [Alicyclobacillus macrosporangiidus]SFU57683.1 UDP-N-acetylglucosamine 1-carboxyvinyltransferase [Alicyclobacillus macrosporangiidus]